MYPDDRLFSGRCTGPYYTMVYSAIRIYTKETGGLVSKLLSTTFLTHI